MLRPTLRGFLLWSANRSVALRSQCLLLHRTTPRPSAFALVDLTPPTRMFGASHDHDGNESDDSAKRIRLPNLKYGYRSDPFEWEELLALFDTDTPDLRRLSRSVEQQRDYEVFKRDLLLTWRSVLDSILCKTFDTIFERNVNEDGKYIALPNLSDVQGTHTRLVLNDFPYFMEPGIDHYVLWKIGGGACNETDICERKQQLVEMGYDETMIHWVNPPNLKSIPEVDHVHLLARRKNRVK